MTGGGDVITGTMRLLLHLHTLFALALVTVPAVAGEELGSGGARPRTVECPPDAVREDEPPLEHGYIDMYNGGCGSSAADPLFLTITEPRFCGVSGFFTADGEPGRDTDFFLVPIPASGEVEITRDADLRCLMAVFWPQECSSADVVQGVSFGEWDQRGMVVAGEPGATIWLGVRPLYLTDPGGSDLLEFDYVLEFSLDPVAVAKPTWTEIRGLFD